MRMTEKKDNGGGAGGGIGIAGALGVAFVVLKLTGYINWSWWWVTAPFWIPIGLAILFVLFGTILMAINDR